MSSGRLPKFMWYSVSIEDAAFKIDGFPVLWEAKEEAAKWTASHDVRIYGVYGRSGYIVDRILVWEPEESATVNWKNEGF